MDCSGGGGEVASGWGMFLGCMHNTAHWTRVCLHFYRLSDLGQGQFLIFSRVCPGAQHSLVKAPNRFKGCLRGRD